MKIDANKLGKPTNKNTSAYLTAMFSPNAGAQSLEVPIEQLTPWQDAEYKVQPFHPYTPEKLTELAENIAENGIISPVFLRPYGQGYQILAGHNRVAAAKMAGLTTVPAVVRDLDDNEARIVLTDSNLFQREVLLPSEKAWAYRIRMEAIKRQGQRATSRQLVGKLKDGQFIEDTSRQVVGKWESADEIGITLGDSGRQVQRYIRLTYLIVPLLKRVDTEGIPFTAGVTLSYLDEGQQSLLWDVMQQYCIKKVNRAQAEELKSFSEELDEFLMLRIFGLSTPIQKFKPITFKVPSEMLPPDIPKKLFGNAEFQRRFVLLVQDFIKSEVHS